VGGGRGGQKQGGYVKLAAMWAVVRVDGLPARQWRDQRQRGSNGGSGGSATRSSPPSPIPTRSPAPACPRSDVPVDDCEDPGPNQRDRCLHTVVSHTAVGHTVVGGATPNQMAAAVGATRVFGAQREEGTPGRRQPLRDRTGSPTIAA